MTFQRSIAGLVILVTAALVHAQDTPTLHDGRAAASWAADLTSTDLGARRKAVFALWKVGWDARPHVRALAKLLRDDDAYVRSTAKKVLLRFDWRRALNTLTPAIPELLDALGDERVEVRLAAINLIWSAGRIPIVVGGDPPPKTYFPALVTALRDDDARVRANAAELLAVNGKRSDQILPALRKALGDDDARVRIWSVRGVSGIDPTTGMASILKLQDDSDEGVRVAVLRAAGLASGESVGAAYEALQTGSRDDASSVRKAAVVGLGSLARSEALPTLIRVLKEDADLIVRDAAARALGRIGDPSAAPQLLAAMSPSDRATITGGADGLARLGPEGAIGIPKMIELLESGSDPQRGSIAVSLGLFGPLGEPFVPALVGNLQSGSSGVRAGAASALSGLASNGIRSEAMTAAVVAAVMDDEPSVREYAVGTVGTIGGEARGAVPGLLLLFARKEEQVSKRVIFYALQNIGPEAIAALPVLRKASSEPGPDRLAAAAALACVATDRNEIDGAVQVLVGALADEKQRHMALYRLKSVGLRARGAAPKVRVFMTADSRWDIYAAGAVLRMEGEGAKDAVAILAGALNGERARSAMTQISDIGPEGRGLIPALLVHALDPASSLRTGALATLTRMNADGAKVREAYERARKDKNGWVRVLGASGLVALEKTQVR